LFKYFGFVAHELDVLFGFLGFKQEFGFSFVGDVHGEQDGGVAVAAGAFGAGGGNLRCAVVPFAEVGVLHPTRTHGGGLVRGVLQHPLFVQQHTPGLHVELLPLSLRDDGEQRVFLVDFRPLMLSHPLRPAYRLTPEFDPIDFDAVVLQFGGILLHDFG